MTVVVNGGIILFFCESVMSGKIKLKTVRGAVKRFRKTSKSASKIRCKAAFRSHNLAKQNTKRRKQKIGGQVVNKSDFARVNRMIQAG